MVERRFGRFVIQPGRRQLLIDGRSAKIGSRAFDILTALVERRQRVVSKDELLDLVWPGISVEESNLQVHVLAPLKASLHSLRNICGFATAILALTAATSGAFAEEIAFTSPCSIVGNAAPEPLGDREGHAIFVEEDICRFDSGPFAGGVMTATSTWEFDKTNAVLVSSSAIFRTPGAVAVGRLTEGTIALTITDGKVSGVTSSARGNWPITTGSAASLAGKSFTATGKTLDPGNLCSNIRWGNSATERPSHSHEIGR